MSMPSQFSPPQPGGGRTLVIVLLVVLGLVVLACGGLCAGCYFVVGRTSRVVGKGLEEFAKSAALAPAYLSAMQAAISDPQVIDRLGEPITQTDHMVPYRRQGEGELRPAGETLQFDIRGPKGTGIVSVVAIKGDDGAFHAAKITVTFGDGSVVDVPTPDESSKSPDGAENESTTSAETKSAP
jgi:hypothetical protein